MLIEFIVKIKIVAKIHKTKNCVGIFQSALFLKSFTNKIGKKIANETKIKLDKIDFFKFDILNKFNLLLLKIGVKVKPNNKTDLPTHVTRNLGFRLDLKTVLYLNF